MTDRDSDGDGPAAFPEGSDPRVSDGGVSPGIDEDELYEIVHDAVEDAILGAVGTLLLVGIGVLLFASGAAAVGQAEGTAAVAVGLGVALLGGGLVVTTLTDVLPVDRWF
ncbi:hypothetical protein ACFQMA_11300 [Halosimplex aquaticum]|uniref:Major facilitator superfamily (MFS) profile domain-containing protein n=1 Tax=Halosimplex aquaticum TaxID=3026162 RepID=A0ABD5XZ42_9EURY|nr:hypothetical protein [Halosimplex aquaticum]